MSQPNSLPSLPAESARLVATWLEPDDPDDLYRVRIELPGQGFFVGSFNEDSEHGLNGLKLVTDEFNVTGEWGKGTGTRIMMGALALAKAYGATHTSASVESPAALRIRQKLFGENITIRDIRTSTPPLPITVEQAIMTLQHQQLLYDLGEDIDRGLVVESSLTDIDTSLWEVPVELNEPLSNI